MGRCNRGVLRERVNALALRLEDAACWEELPVRFTVYEAKICLFRTGNVGLLPFGQFVRCQDAQTAYVMANWLSDIYVTESIVQGLSLRRQLPAGAWFVTPEGHLIGTCSILFHAPDNHVHGILARQREMERLLEVVQQLELRVTHSQRQTALAEESCRDIENRIALLRAMDSELQKRQHEVQVDILKLTQAGERSQDRTSQIDFELKELSEQSASEKQHFLEIRERMEMLHETIEVQQRETEQVKLQMLSRESNCACNVKNFRNCETIAGGPLSGQNLHGKNRRPESQPHPDRIDYCATGIHAQPDPDRTGSDQ